jgi:hypothetical protein
MCLAQQDIIANLSGSSGIGSKQIGQSVLSVCRNKISSRNSAAFFLQARLCCDLCSFWHLMLQYRADLHPVHVFNFMSSASVAPQEAQRHVTSSASAAFVSLICPEDKVEGGVMMLQWRSFFFQWTIISNLHRKPQPHLIATRA